MSTGYDPWVKEVVDRSIEALRGTLDSIGYAGADNALAYEEYVKEERERLYHDPRLMEMVDRLRRREAAEARERILDNRSFMFTIWPTKFGKPITEVEADLAEIEALDLRDPQAVPSDKLPHVAAEVITTWDTLHQTIKEARQRVVPSRSERKEDPNAPKKDRKAAPRKNSVTAFVQRYDAVQEAVLIGMRVAAFHTARSRGTAAAREVARFLWFELNDNLSGWGRVHLDAARGVQTPANHPALKAAVVQVRDTGSEEALDAWLQDEALILGVLPSGGSFGPLIESSIRSFVGAFDQTPPEGQTAALAAPFDTEPADLREYPGPWTDINVVARWMCRAADDDLRLRTFLSRWLDHTAPSEEAPSDREVRAVAALHALAPPEGGGHWAFDVCGPMTENASCIDRLVPQRAYYSGNVLGKHERLADLVAAADPETGTLVAEDAIGTELLLAAARQLESFKLEGSASWANIIANGTFDPRDTYIPDSVLSAWVNSLQVATSVQTSPIYYKVDSPAWSIDTTTREVPDQRPVLGDNRRMDYWNEAAEATANPNGSGFVVPWIDEFNEHTDGLSPVNKYAPRRVRLVRLPLYTTAAIQREHSVQPNENAQTIADRYGMKMAELLNLNTGASFAPKTSVWVWATIPMRAFTSRASFKSAYSSQISDRVRMFLGWLNNDYTAFAPDPFVTADKLERLYGPNWANEAWPAGFATLSSAIGSEFVPPKHDVLDQRGVVITPGKARWTMGEMALVCSVKEPAKPGQPSTLDAVVQTQLEQLFPALLGDPTLQARMVTAKKKIKATRADARRDNYSAMFTASLSAWLEEEKNAPHQALVTRSYNEKWKSYRLPEYDGSPITADLVRAAKNHKPPSAGWRDGDFVPPGYIIPYPFQNAGARRLVDQGGGLLAFDVGVGKTLTATMAMAKARQEGKAKRCVVTVPNGITAKWLRDIRNALPDYRVEIIGQHYTSPTKRHFGRSRELAFQRARAQHDLLLARFTDARTAWEAELLRSAKVNSFVDLDGTRFRIKSSLRTTKDKVEQRFAHALLVAYATVSLEGAFNVVAPDNTEWLLYRAPAGWKRTHIAPSGPTHVRVYSAQAIGSGPGLSDLRKTIPVESAFLLDPKTKAVVAANLDTATLFANPSDDAEFQRVGKALADAEAEALALNGSEFFTAPDANNKKRQVVAIRPGMTGQASWTQAIVENYVVPKPDPVSETDSATLRARKWRDFQRGRYDVVVVPHSTFGGNTALDKAAVKEHIFSSPAMLRAVETEMMKGQTTQSVDPTTGKLQSVARNRGVELMGLLDEVLKSLNSTVSLTTTEDLPVPLHDANATLGGLNWNDRSSLLLRDASGRDVDAEQVSHNLPAWDHMGMVYIDPTGVWAAAGGVAGMARLTTSYRFMPDGALRVDSFTPSRAQSPVVFPQFLPNPTWDSAGLVAAAAGARTLNAKAVVSQRIPVNNMDSIESWGASAGLSTNRPLLLTYGAEVLAVVGYDRNPPGSPVDGWIDVFRFPWGFHGAKKTISHTAGSGDGRQLTFHFTLPNTPIWPGNVIVGYGSDGAPGSVRLTDDGNGRIGFGSGDGSGVIDYASGAGSVTFTVAPAAAKPKRGNQPRQLAQKVTVWSNGVLVGTPATAPIPAGAVFNSLTDITLPTNKSMEQYAVDIEQELNDPKASFRIEAAEAWINKKLEGKRDAIDPAAKGLFEHVLSAPEATGIVTGRGDPVQLPNKLAGMLNSLGVPIPSAGVAQGHFYRTHMDQRAFLGEEAFTGVFFADNVQQRYPDGVLAPFQFKGAALRDVRATGSKQRNGGYFPVLYPVSIDVLQATQQGVDGVKNAVQAITQEVPTEVSLGAMQNTEETLRADQRALYAEFAAGVLIDVLSNPNKALPARMGPDFAKEFADEMVRFHADTPGPYYLDLPTEKNKAGQPVLKRIVDYGLVSGARFSDDGVSKRASYVAQIPVTADRLPNGEEIVWDNLGCDFLIVDEAHKFKNLYLPAKRGSLGGGKVEFLDLGASSDQAWQMEFRCAAVRAAGGRVVTLTATPATTSPIEFYNVMSYIGIPGRPHETVFSPVGISDPEEFISRYVEIKDDIVSKPGGDPQEVKAAKRIKNPEEFRLIFDRYANRKTVDDSPNLRGREVAYGPKGKWTSVVASTITGLPVDDGRELGAFRPASGDLAEVAGDDRFRLKDGGGASGDYRIYTVRDGIIYVEPPFPTAQDEDETGEWAVYSGSRVPIAQATKRVLVGLGKRQFDAYVGYQQHMGQRTGQGMGNLLNKMMRISAHPGLALLSAGTSSGLEVPEDDEDAEAAQVRNNESEAARFSFAVQMALPLKLGRLGHEFDARPMLPLDTDATRATQLGVAASQKGRVLLFKKPGSRGTTLVEHPTDEYSEAVWVEETSVAYRDALRERKFNFTDPRGNDNELPLIPAPFDLGNEGRFPPGRPIPIIFSDPELTRDSARIFMEVVMPFRPGEAQKAGRKSKGTQKAISAPWVMAWRVAVNAAELRTVRNDALAAQVAAVAAGTVAVHPYYVVSMWLAEKCLVGAGGMYDPSLDPVAKAAVVRYVEVEAMRRIVGRQDYLRANALRWGIDPQVIAEAEANPYRIEAQAVGPATFRPSTTP